MMRKLQLAVPGLLLALLLTLSGTGCKDGRSRTGSQGDVGAGGVQEPNKTDSTVSHDSTVRIHKDTARPPGMSR